MKPFAAFATLKKLALPGVVVVWSLALVPGVRALMAYERAAGGKGVAPTGWPAGVAEVGEAGLPTLVVALHPRCSCSAATLTELEEVAAENPHRFNAELLIWQPRGSSAKEADGKWQDVGLYKRAQEALGATVVMDEEGGLAKRFGAETSGEVLLYSAGKRELLFAGGVTGGRGMTGENVGVELLKAAFRGRRRESAASAPVFGCGLFGSRFVGNGGAQ